MSYLTSQPALARSLSNLGNLSANTVPAGRFAHLYGQRPSPRDLARLNATVTATVFVAGELDDLDLGEQVEPILSSAMGALGASVPGFQVAGTIPADCVPGASGCTKDAGTKLWARVSSGRFEQQPEVV